MQHAGTSFRKIWFDEHAIELEILTSDGVSTFANKVYTGLPELKKLVEGLDQFKRQIHGGIFDVRLGEFGPEYAGGAFHARLHFHVPGHGRLFVSVHAESEWHDFTRNKVAARADIYFTTEPALFDRFIDELRMLQEGRETEASLRTV